MGSNPNFPEYMVCRGMPSLDGRTAEMRVDTRDDEPPSPDFTVLLRDLVWVNMPPLPRPEEIGATEGVELISAIRPMFEQFGLALVACRVEERHPNHLIVAVPDVRGVVLLAVKPERLARPHNPKRHDE